MTRYVESLDEREAIRDEIAREGWTVGGYNGQPRPHPLLGRLGVLERHLTSLEDRLGFNPAERGRMGLAEVRAANVLDTLRAKRHRREGKD